MPILKSNQHSPKPQERLHKKQKKHECDGREKQKKFTTYSQYGSVNPILFLINPPPSLTMSAQEPAQKQAQVPAQVALIPQSLDGEPAQRTLVDREVVMQSLLIQKMLDDEDDPSEIAEIPLPQVPEDMLALVVKFLNKHSKDPMRKIEKPIASCNMVDIVGQWDANFVAELEQEQLFKLVLAANYLDIKSLLDLGVCKIACAVKESMNDMEQLKEKFGIETNITPEEERKIREENPWIFDVAPKEA